MKKIILTSILFSVFVITLQAQITFRGCVPVLGAQDFTLAVTGTNLDNGLTRNIYESTPLNFTQSCPSGVCEIRIVWNIVLNRWEIQLDNDGSLGAPDYTTAVLYFSTTATLPNPPDLNSGNWQDAGFCPDAITTFSGDINDGSTLSNIELEFKDKYIKLHPNPSNTILNIEMKTTLYKAIIYNVIGAKVLESASKKINTSNLKSGIYLITIEDQTGVKLTKRFIKR